MKKLLILALMLACIPSYASVAEGDAAYAAGNFAEALKQYENALVPRRASAELYYNIGNSYFKLGETGRAVAYYTKAFKLSPRNADIRHNLEFALARTGQHLVPDGLPPALHRAFFFFSGAELRGLFFIFLWVFCFALIFYIFKRKGKKLVFALGFLAVLAAAWYAVYRTAAGGYNAVTVSQTAQLRGGPGDSFEVTATLPEGYYVDLTDAKDDWVLAVNYKDDNMRGWAKKSNFINLKDI